MDRGSTVYVAALDIQKAYDSVNFYKLFNSLLNAGVPRCVVDVRFEWYGKLNVGVRWNGCNSRFFKMGSGVGKEVPYCLRCSVGLLVNLLCQCMKQQRDVTYTERGLAA
jgi:hypothetical protein